MAPYDSAPVNPENAAQTPRQRPRMARNTAIFAVATALSRAAGLAREVVASSYFGTSGPFSAFTLAFQIPNLVRSLVADAAISAAFVPVFTDLLEKGKRREAFRLATTLALLILIGLSALSALFIIFAGAIMPLFIGKGFTPVLTELTVGLSQVLFPILVLLGLNGLVVGILNARDHFAIPAIAPVVWNLVIIAALVILRPQFGGQDQIYAYAIGVLVATAIQLLMALPVLPLVGFRFELAFNWRDPNVRQVFRLMVPVTVGLGIINLDLLINSSVGSTISAAAPRAIDAAFRIYMLPQGIFSVAVATVLFPALGRLVARRDMDGLVRLQAQGVRIIMLFLVPAAALMAVLATPIVRLVYERGQFGPGSTQLVATALVWFSLSLPFAGVNLLLTRTFFALRLAWIPTGLALANLVLNAILSLALAGPLGIAGPVIGTAVASIGMTAGQLWFLRRHAGRIEAGSLVDSALRIIAASAVMAGAAWFVWSLLNRRSGAGLFSELVSVGAGIGVGIAVFASCALIFRIPEARLIRDRALAFVRVRRNR